jgi:hypothetical protein
MLSLDFTTLETFLKPQLQRQLERLDITNKELSKSVRL